MSKTSKLIAAAEAAEAESHAADARSRATELRLQQEQPDLADSRPASICTEEERERVSVPDVSSPEPSPAEPTITRRFNWRRRRWVLFPRNLAICAAILTLLGLLSGSALMMRTHHLSTQRAQSAEAFVAGARQGVVNLMTLNFDSADSDLQRVLNTTTGSFRADFQDSQQDILKLLKEGHVASTTTVNRAALESMAGDSAVVLVAATSQVTNAASKQPDPRAWRLAVTVVAENDGVKLSKVEFVP